MTGVTGRGIIAAFSQNLVLPSHKNNMNDRLILKPKQPNPSSSAISYGCHPLDALEPTTITWKTTSLEYSILVHLGEQVWLGSLMLSAYQYLWKERTTGPVDSENLFSPYVSCFTGVFFHIFSLCKYLLLREAQNYFWPFLTLFCVRRSISNSVNK